MVGDLSELILDRPCSPFSVTTDVFAPLAEWSGCEGAGIFSNAWNQEAARLCQRRGFSCRPGTGTSAQGVPRSALSVRTAPHARVAFGASPSPRRPVRQLFLLGPLVSCHSPQEHTQKAVYAGRASGQTQVALRGPFRGGWAQQQSSAWGFEEPRPSRAAVAARRLVAPWFLLLFPGP